MKIRILMTLLAAMFCGPAQAGLLPAGHIDTDEEILFYPAFGRLDDSGTTWTIELHAAVYEPEPDSIWRRALIRELTEALDLDRLDSTQTLTLDKRLRLFLVDLERNQKVRLRLAGREYDMAPTAPDGHARLTIQIPAAGLKTSDTQTTGGAPWVVCRAVLPPPQTRVIEGRIQLIPPAGATVVSDIDDTIKVTGILDRKQMLANTFIMPPAAVDGMPERYRQWEASGAVFHYVSGSPWQLAPPIAELIESAGYPAGSFHLRSFRLGDSSLVKFLMLDAGAHKKEQIERLLGLFPRRDFILVGDTGEQDPEIYGDLARRHPGRIRTICLRKIQGSDLSDARWKKAFAGIPPENVQLFSQPSEIH